LIGFPPNQAEATNGNYSKIVRLFVVIKLNHCYSSICQIFDSKNTAA